MDGVHSSASPALRGERMLASKGKDKAGWPLRFVVLAFGVTMYGQALEAVYLSIIVPLYYYLGEKGQPVSWETFPWVILMAAASGLLLPPFLSRTQDFILWVCYVVMIIPAMVVPHFTTICSPGQAMLITASAGASFVFICLALGGLPDTGFPTRPLDRESYVSLLLVAWLVGNVYVAVLTDVQLSAPSLTEIYTTRLEYRGIVSEAGPLLGYVVRWLMYVVNPFLMVVSVATRTWRPFLLGAAGQWYVYSLTGYKVALLSGLAIIAVLYLYRRRQPLGVSLVLAASGLGFAAWFIYEMSGNNVLALILVYRFMIVSGTLPAAYFDFFEHRDYVMWSDSFLEGWVAPRYDTNMIFLVGAEHTGSAEVSVNSNYIADGYGNLGILGVAIEALVLILVLWMVISASRGIPVKLTSCLLITAIVGLVNASPMTSVLSNGFLAAAVLLALMPRDWRSREEKLRCQRARSGARSRRLSESASSDLSVRGDGRALGGRRREFVASTGDRPSVAAQG